MCRCQQQVQTDGLWLCQVCPWPLLPCPALSCPVCVSPVLFYSVLCVLFCPVLSVSDCLFVQASLRAVQGEFVSSCVLWSVTVVHVVCVHCENVSLCLLRFTSVCLSRNPSCQVGSIFLLLILPSFYPEGTVCC